MATPKPSLIGVATVLLLAVALLAACGGGEEVAPTARPTQLPTATSPASTPATPTLAPSTPLTLAISSISPSPARVGDEVTIIFKTQPGASIGFEIYDPQGQTVVQTLVTAGSDGTATFKRALTGPKGTWRVEAAAGASLQDLLRLQAQPTSGPETADATFEMQ